MKISALSPGGRPVRVVRPSDPDRLLNDPHVLESSRRGDYMPYWPYLWPGAFLLAEAVAGEAWESGTRALEIGCGLGLAGLAGVASGLNVTFTDHDAAPLRFVELSGAENGFPPGAYDTRLLDWRDPTEERFPVILGADVLYEHRLVALVAELIGRMLAPDGLALVAGTYRAATEELPAHLSRHGLEAQAQAIEAIDEQGELVRGTLHRIRRARPIGGAD